MSRFAWSTLLALALVGSLLCVGSAALAQVNPKDLPFTPGFRTDSGGIWSVDSPLPEEIGILGISDSGDWTQTQYFKTPFSMACPVWAPSGESIVVRRADGTRYTLPVGVVLRDQYGRYRTTDMHGGVDYYASDYSFSDIPLERRQVYCAADGWVRYRGYDASGYGYCVLVNHEGNRDNVDTDLCTLYAHLAQPSFKNVGDFVSKGSAIGYVGHTGNASATWSHLHFEILSRDWTHRYDPIPYMLTTYIGDREAVWESWVKVYYPSSVTKGSSIGIDVKVTRAHNDGNIITPYKAVIRWRPVGSATWRASPDLTARDSYGNIVDRFVITASDYGAATGIEFYVQAFKNSTNYATSPVDNKDLPPDTGNYYRVQIQ